MSDLEEVLKFWFVELKPQDWFKKSDRLDRTISARFAELHSIVCENVAPSDKDTPRSLLAKVIVLDQFSRNMFRDTAKAFAYDDQALALAVFAVKRGWDNKLTAEERSFLYMPYMHSESPQVHKTALDLFARLGNAINLKFERQHKAIIDRFGRYPHRNQVLGRKSTAEELAFLQLPGSSF
ncbi:DUF924 family protein [Gilvimarinus sp. DA14]|uniref:DUF924 family protein n=1 Tax=Gilvimarinus sp. DA14 TaxID=2956798 RepID=UPI0020B8E9F3|nr:DUF924 family protein [Gilvimarinus sp. DA14]UTF61641.1 DUF924 domain-containing protein [Gilvimarinus sp. DA14]